MVTSRPYFILTFTDVRFFPALVKKYFTEFLVSGYLLDSSGWSTFESTVNSITWPSGIGRLPTNVSSFCLTSLRRFITICPQLGDDHSLPKADQWQRLSSILPVVLWVCWKDQRGRIKKSHHLFLPMQKLSRSSSATSRPFIILCSTCLLLNASSPAKPFLSMMWTVVSGTSSSIARVYTR